MKDIYCTLCIIIILITGCQPSPKLAPSITTDIPSGSPTPAKTDSPPTAIATSKFLPSQSPIPEPTASPTFSLPPKPTVYPLPSPDPDLSAQDYIERGIANYEADELKEALLSFDLAIVLDPWNLEIYQYHRAVRLELEARQSLENLDKEITSCDQTISQDPEDAEAYYQRGCVKYLRTLISGEPADVKPMEFPENVTVHGEINTSSLILVHAISDFDQAIRLNPGYSDAYHMRGLAYHVQGLKYINIALSEIDSTDFKKALRDYDEAIGLNPEFADAYHDRGTAYLQRGYLDGRQVDEIPEEAFQDLERSLNDFTMAIKHSPKAENTYLNRAFANLLRKHWLEKTDVEEREILQQAIDDATQVIQLNPENMWGYLFRAWAYVEAQESAENKATAAEFESLAEKDGKIYEKLTTYMRIRFTLEDLVTRVPTLSLGPTTNPLPRLEGRIEGEVYISPREGFKLKIPKLMQPNAVIWDEVAASGDQVVCFRDDLKRWYVFQVHPGEMGENSLMNWTQTNIASHLEVQEFSKMDSQFGDAVVLLYRDNNHEANCSMVVLHYNQQLFSAIYCLEDEEEAGYRMFAPGYGIQIEPVDGLVKGFFNGLTFISD